MTERRVLILTQQRLTAYAGQGGQVRTEATFELDEAGQADFRAWLERHRSALMHLLVDLPDEGFQLETLPHVTGADRKALLARKQNQLFFGTPYTMVRSLGRDRQGRRDEHFLFSALTRPQALEPWLQAMHEAAVAVAGIHTPALLLSRLLNRRMAEAPRLILITLGSGGLRQSYFEHGQLRFSRLKPLGTGAVEEAAVNAYGEAVRIYQYLVGQRLLARGNKVPVLCLANPTHFELLRRACVDTEELHFSFADLRELAPGRQLPPGSDASSLDPLLAHMLLRHAPATQFGNAEARIDFRRWQWRAAIRRASLGLLGLCVAMVAATALHVWLGRARIADAKLAAQLARQQYAALVQSLPAIPISPEQLRTLIGQWQQLQAQTLDLASSLRPLSAALEANPQVELDALYWRLAAHPDDKGSARGGSADWLVMDIDAQLPPALGPDRRAQNDSIDRFAAALAASPQDQVRVLQRPFDTDSGKALKGSSEIYDEHQSLGFSVRYWRKLQP